MNGDITVTVRGTVVFFWDSDEEGHLLVNIEPDELRHPDAFELSGEVRTAVAEAIEEGARIAIEYHEVHHELVDPEAATTHDASRPRVVAAWIESA